jgi:predicted RNA-binding Zn ribbon-like protein
MQATQGPDDLCLALVNTRDWRDERIDTLRTHADAVAWFTIHLPAFAEPAGSLAPADAGLALAAIVGLRSILHNLLATAAAGQTPDLAALNLALRQAAPRAVLRGDAASLGWELDAPPRFSATWLLSPVLWSAADLLAGPRRTRLRCCANPKCARLFLDDSKSANRRWCSMSSCGNRAKAQRHYRKTKAAGL